MWRGFGKHRDFYILLLSPSIILAVIIWFIVYQLSFHSGLASLSEKDNNTLELYVAYLKGMLEKHESLPELLTSDDLLVKSLLNPGSRQRIDELNRYLETINKISGTSDTYLMDQDGLTIAASNWQEERPFIGRNFSYRPYFKTAMRGELGRYFALGTTSSRRGYYFAYPVRKGKDILGAVVVKIKVDAAEDKWGHLEQELVVLDPDGVVFITTNPAWKFKVFGNLAAQDKARIEKSRRYPVSTLSSLNIKQKDTFGASELIEIQNSQSLVGPANYLVQSQKMENAGWNVKILSDINAVKGKAFRLCLYTLMGEIVSFLIFVLLIQRQKRLAQLKEYELQTRKMLQQSNEQLESRVEVRTAELTDSNERLTREINERIKAEEELKQTRDELIHAAKLAALGQMSASINHEMNQPLAAIRSYAENGRLFLEKDRVDDALWNLDQIAELTERMGQVVAQLKLFSRKSSGKIVRVPLHGAIDGALEILNPIIRKLDLKIDVILQPENIEVMANNVLLQQVFVNLINNAIQAVEGVEQGNIRILAEKSRGKVIIIVEDNGSGIPDDKLEHIFEPFFTTKISGQGLGLGLTITDRILQEIEGSAFVTSSSAGTTFKIELDAAGK